MKTFERRGPNKQRDDFLLELERRDEMHVYRRLLPMVSAAAARAYIKDQWRKGIPLKFPEPAENNNKVVTPEEHARIAELYTSGMSLAEVARAVGRPRGTVDRSISLAGLKRHKKIADYNRSREKKPRELVSQAEIRRAFAQGFADVSKHEMSTEDHKTMVALIW